MQESQQAPLSPRHRTRGHRTRGGVLLADRLSRWIITVSGIGTILAISLVFVFLVIVAVPLFWPASVRDETAVSLPPPGKAETVAFKDSKGVMTWSLGEDGTLTVSRPGDGKVLEQRQLFPDGPAVTARTSPLQRLDDRNEPFWDLALGFADGTAALAKLRFDYRNLIPTDVAKLAKEYRDLTIGQSLPLENGVLLRDGVELFVHITLKAETEAPMKSASAEPVEKIALAFGDKGPVTAVATRDRKLSLLTVEEKKIGVRVVGRTPRSFEVRSETPEGRGPFERVRLSHAGDQVYLLWDDGFYQRIDAAVPAEASVAGTGYVLGRGRVNLPHLRHPIIASDEDQRLAWTLSPEGVLTVFRLDTGELLERRPLFDSGPPLTASSQPVDRSEMIDGKKENYKEISFGFLDGAFRIGKLRIKSTFLDPAVLPDNILRLKEGQVTRLGSGLVVRTPEGQYRLEEFRIELQNAPPVEKPDPILLIDHAITRFESFVCVLTEGGSLRRDEVRLKTNFVNKQTTVERLGETQLPYHPSDGGGTPDVMLLNASGDNLYLIRNNGEFRRISIRPGNPPQVMETGNLIGENGRTVTKIWQMLGRQTMLVGDSSGRVRAWFPATTARGATKDGFITVCGHTFESVEGSPVSALAGTSRSRLAAVGQENGSIRVLQVTSEKEVIDLSLGQDKSVSLLGIAPKEDGVLALSGERGKLWTIDPKHPEITLRSLFFPVWYEGSDAPRQHWESSSGDDAFEPKYGLVPLVFGTLKASFYSLLFGVPLALLAAVYTSEFMNSRTKAIVKPTIEMMASLPSVVLGFLAGLVFAQFVENVVPAVLCGFVAVPLTFVLLARLTQLLPERLSLRLTRVRFLFFLPALLAGIGLATLAGPVVERLLFAGDIKQWLSSDKGCMIGGWILLFLPISVVLTILLMSWLIMPVLRQITAGRSRAQVAWIDLGKWLLSCVVAPGIALLLAWLMHLLGQDTRGLFLGTYSQRNALVVGFVMGFAIIPIIYTIADDALSSVPEHLRSGSLATGATPWQTAVRIVIPTAMSGLFSAVMIGMGRAVGETMIVVMATGNTPVMDMNMFNGFRTLSANIAVELPEAARHSTHYRTLFLAALVLFVMTFILNTVAEMVRLRFRRRAYQL